MTAHQSINARPLVEHGGRLAAARRLYPGAPQPWIDLSTGVNPRAYPLPPLPADAFTRLPDDDAMSALETAARGAYRAPAEVEIVAGAGAQGFIQTIPRAFPARRVASSDSHTPNMEPAGRRPARMSTRSTRSMRWRTPRSA